ncbi:MAG: phosphoribosylanthranilate isomerase [Bryobacteraceae bacterium]
MTGIIKICGITNEEDARVSLEAGANALGFNFYRKSPRYISPIRAREIVDAVSGAFLKVGIFVNAGEKELLDIGTQVPLDVLQLHGDWPSLTTSHRIWRATRPDAALNGSGVEAYLIDTPNDEFGGSGKTFDWRLAAGHKHRIIIAGGLDSSNVRQAIETAQPWGVDACSRLESEPGKKDPQRVRDFVEAALAAGRL